MSKEKPLTKEDRKLCSNKVGGILNGVRINKY